MVLHENHRPCIITGFIQVRRFGFMNSGSVDLHIHTTHSDGSMTPAEVVAYARLRKLSAIAVTDHDTVSGNAEALAEGSRLGMEVIPGVELSIFVPKGEFHLLGYYLDYTHPGLLAALAELREHRRRRNPLIIKKLSDLGIQLNYEEIRLTANNGNIGRPHIAAAMVRGGFVSSIKDAFDHYLRKDGPAYVPKEILSPREGIQIIRESGGVPVLAHPYTLEMENARELVLFVDQLKNLGLQGIEVFYLGSSRQQIRLYEQVANQLGLCKTGGSDFHGTDKPGIEIGTGRGTCQLPYQLVTGLKSAWNGGGDSSLPLAGGLRDNPAGR